MLSIGYLGDQIRAAVGDGSNFGLHIEFCEDGPTPIGTAAAIRKAQPLLGERFLVLYGDTYLRVDFAQVDRVAAESGLPALMTVLRNRGRWDVSNVDFPDGRMLRYDKRSPRPDMEHIDYGLSVLTAAALEQTDATATDLSTLFTDLAARGLLAGYEASQRFYEIGTPSARAETDAFLRGELGLTADLPAASEGQAYR